MAKKVREELKRLGVELRRLDESGVPKEVLENGIELTHYNVGPVEVRILEYEGRGYYVAIEPKLSNIDIDAYYEAMYLLYFGARHTVVEEPEKVIEEVISLVAKRFRKRGTINREALKYYIVRDALGYKVLDVVIRDPRIEDISLEGVGKPLRVFHRDFSYLDWLQTNIVFQSSEELDAIAMLLAHKARKHVSTAFPIAEGMLPERHRLALTFSYEVSPFGTGFTIRKFREEPLTIAHLIKYGSLSPLMAAYWWILLEFKGSVFIVGAMASGKTTLLNALLTLLPPNWKIVTIEDTPELRLPHSGWRPLVARHVYLGAEVKAAEITLFDLVRLALRERADFIVIGEIRGEEAYVFMQALATGHGGACTFHSDSIESMVYRLTTPPINVPIGFLPLISSVALTRYIKIPGRKPVRRVVAVHEIVDAREPREVEYVTVFRWIIEKDIHEPSTPEEVVEKSSKLRKVMELAGWTRSMLVEELEERARLLQKLVEENRLSYEDVALEIRKFYRRKWFGR